MSSQLHTDSPTVEASVDEWRFQQLQQSGWPEQEALLLAARHEIDLHQACDLLQHGCDPGIAWRILY